MTEEKEKSNAIHASIHDSDKDIGMDKSEKKKKKSDGAAWIKKVLAKVKK